MDKTQNQTDASMTALDRKIETWKNKLLDLSKRNRLLNYRPTKRSSVHIGGPSMLEIWESFVVRKEPQRFPYVDDDMATPEGQGNPRQPNPTDTSNFVEQQKTLRNLRAKAKTVLEEQGVNILYLAFGFLRWQENTDTAGEWFKSPLILVPATLTLKSINAPFSLTPHEGEITINPTLLYKLKSDFNIDFPSFDADETDFKQYLHELSSIVKPNNWEIIDEAVLSLFSFSKINMYEDLEANREKIKTHPVIGALVGDYTQTDIFCRDDETVCDHDTKTTPIDVFQILDADSSQLDAISLAKQGQSFVLQGPPGTGKSQTIANIIAERLAAQKKVLFVSEKMAALDVVRKRLQAAGLIDFCLVLHNHKTNKKELVTELGNTLDLIPPKKQPHQENLEKLHELEKVKQDLNAYTEQISTVVEPLGHTIHQIHAELASLSDYPNIIFTIANIRETTQQKLNTYLDLLTRLASSITQTGTLCKENPWRDANIANTNELRHNINVYLPKILTKIKHLSAICTTIANELELEHTISYNGIPEIQEILSIGAESPKPPTSWITEANLTPIWDLFDHFNLLQQSYREQKNELVRLSSERQDVLKKSPLFDPQNLYSVSHLEEALTQINVLISANECFNVWQNNDIKKTKSVFQNLRKHITSIRETENRILSKFDREIMKIDHKALLARFRFEYKLPTKFFKPRYWSDKKAIQGLSKTVEKNIRDERIIILLTELRQRMEGKSWIEENTEVLRNCFGRFFSAETTDLETLDELFEEFDNIIKIKEVLENLCGVTSEFEKANSKLQITFGDLYNGISTNWESIRGSLKWADVFKKICQNHKVSQQFIKHIYTDSEKINQCAKHLKSLVQLATQLAPEFLWYLNLFENKTEIETLPIPLLQERIQKEIDGIALLEDWVTFRSARAECIEGGLGEYIEKIQENDIPAAEIVPVFKKRFYALWLDSVLVLYPAVQKFRRNHHESKIEDFVTLDKLQFNIAKERIRNRIINGVDINSPVTRATISFKKEIYCLTGEYHKQRRIMPPRKLLRSIPNLLLALKPCIMMSPLSVSFFLESDDLVFDTVIFDEASQVCTETAIGAISRGRQVIIVGDSKQLPPTNFFDVAVGDTDYDDDSDREDIPGNIYESILEESHFLPTCTLRWHYRSRHEHLIAFSNSKIYDNKLITFPANVGRVSNGGVEYIHVPNGFYDRGGRSGNVIEAERVAELVFEHFARFPNRSLGVITFGNTQQQAIDTVLRQMRKRRPDYEPFFAEDNEVPFFIKSLENVQGDERDTIIFSIGYAKDIKGKFPMNFGPLSRVGGERRLNVAITRAKYNVKLVGSIQPGDINIDRINTEGPKLLKQYIDFAQNGPVDATRKPIEFNGTEQGPLFEDTIADFLGRKGYIIEKRVGCSDYRIDIAIKHPTLIGQYAIGIECDGASYHSARTARERDRLRRDRLEDMGWTIYRVWSPDWIKDPISEGKRLVEAVETSIRSHAVFTG